MRTTVGRYEKNLAAKVLVLEAIPNGGHTTIAELDARLDEVEAQAADDFRFATWARGSVSDIVLFLARCDLLSVDFPDGYPRTHSAWKSVRVFQNEHTSRFLEKARREAHLALDLLAPEIRSVAHG